MRIGIHSNLKQWNKNIVKNVLERCHNPHLLVNVVQPWKLGVKNKNHRQHSTIQSLIKCHGGTQFFMENEKKKSVHINRKEREYNCKSRFPLGSKNVLERVTIVDDNQSKFIKSFWHICSIYLWWENIHRGLSFCFESTAMKEKGSVNLVECQSRGWDENKRGISTICPWSNSHLHVKPRSPNKPNDFMNMVVPC